PVRWSREHEQGRVGRLHRWSVAREAPRAQPDASRCPRSSLRPLPASRLTGVARALSSDTPPKVVWIRRGNWSTTGIEEIPRGRQPDLHAFERDAGSPTRLEGLLAPCARQLGEDRESPSRS